MITEKTEAKNPLGTDPIGRLMVRFALPGVFSLVVNALYNLIDQIFVGRGVGYLGNAATNVIFPLTVFGMAVPALLGDGCAACFSLKLGEGKDEEASHSVCNTILFLLCTGIILLLLFSVFLEPLCRLMGGTDQNLPYAKEYGRIIVLGLPFVAIDIGFSAIIRADGSPTYSMIGLLIGCAANMTLDPILIFGCKMGMTGAAVATITGQILNAVFLLFYLPRFKHAKLLKSYFKPSWVIIRKVLSLGTSSFIQQLSMVILVAVSNNLLVKYGALSKYGADIPLATMGITMKVNSIVLNIVQGIGTGSQPILGFNYGAGQYDRTKHTFRLTCMSTTFVLILAFLIFQIFPMSLVSIFGSEDMLYNEFAVKCFRIHLRLCFLNGITMCTSFFFQSVGKPLLASVNTLLKQVVTILLAMVILSALIGVEGVLWGGPASDGISFVIALILLGINWKKIFPSTKAKQK